MARPTGGIRVEQGKGAKDRFGLLSPQLLDILRAWWLQCRSPGSLVPGQGPLLPMTDRQPKRRDSDGGSRRTRCGMAPHALRGMV